MRGLGTMLCDVPAGIAVTRVGDKATMLGGLLVATLACLGFTWTASPTGLAALGLVFGAGIGALMLGRLNYVARHCPAQYRGRALTTLAGIQRLGFLVGPVAGGLCAEALGFGAAFAGAALLNVAGMILVSVFVPRTIPGARQGAHPPLAVIRRILRDHRSIFTRAGLAFVALQFIRSGRQLLVPLWGESIGLDAASIGLVFGLASAIDAAMFYPAGWIMDFRGRKWSAVPSLALLSLSLALLPFTASFWPFLAVVLLSGLGNGFGTGIVMTVGADISPHTNRGEFLGVWRLVGDAGHAAGPFVIGAVEGAVALAGALGFAAGIGLAGAAGAAFFVPETLRREEDPGARASAPPRDGGRAGPI